MAEDRAPALQEGQMAAPRGRPRRSDAEQPRRRKRVGDLEDTSSLAVPQAVKDRLAAEGLEGRWINDIGNRMYLKTELDDWTKVDGVDPVPVGTDHRAGGKVMAYYCAKPKQHLEEDNAARLERWSERERKSLAGNDPESPIEQGYGGEGNRAWRTSI